MLDPRARTAILEYHQGRMTLEAAAQTLAQVHRETGCLALHQAPEASEADRALLARFAELTAVPEPPPSASP